MIAHRPWLGVSTRDWFINSDTPQVQPREISFTAARRAVITTTRAGTATASLPTGLATASAHTTLTELARRRVLVDRHRHRDRKTKTRQGFPTAGPRLATRTAPAEISICGQPTT
jgi:hypothetical protein